MSEAKPVDGDDMTYWWQLLNEAGNISVLDSDSVEISGHTLYGTITGGEVAGLSLVDVPQSYVVQTHAQRTDNALWHMAGRIAELAEKVRKLEQQIADMTADS